MLEKFRDYFNAIDLPAPLIERSEQICNAFKDFIELPLHGVFISDFIEPTAISFTRTRRSRATIRT